MFASPSSRRRLHIGTRSGSSIPNILDQHLDDFLMERDFRLYQLFSPTACD